jgi:Arc/MetJ-type ribon-helix-helix transcriptional regulator
MRMTINISVPEEMHAYLQEECGYLTVSEYIRSLVRREQQRRADYASRPREVLTTANDCMIIAQALIQLDKLKAVLEQTDPYD